MSRTWQTAEVIRRLGEADADEVQELVEEAGDEAAEALKNGFAKEMVPRACMMPSCALRLLLTIRLILSIGRPSRNGFARA